MPKKIIAVDIDDVLADNARGFIEFSNSQWGSALTPEDYDEYWAQVWGVSEDEARRRATLFHEEGIVASYSHDETALPVLRELQNRYELAIVTSRRLTIQSHTYEWIHRHYPGIFSDETIHFAGIWDGEISKATSHRTKGELCHGLGVSYLIDDQLKHCTAAAERGIRSVLYGNYSWNKSASLPAGVVRMTSWQEIAEYFDGRDD